MNELDYSDIGIVYTAYVTIDDVESLVEHSVNMRCGNTDSKIKVCSSGYCYSTEWPAVIVVHTVMADGGGGGGGAVRRMT